MDIKRLFIPVIAGKKVAVIPWYLAGGIASADCIAAYKPLGAADYATSKINLNNPGTNDLSDGAAYPTFNAATGWTFAGASSQFLEQATVPKKVTGFTVFVAGVFTDVTSDQSAIFGTRSNAVKGISLMAEVYNNTGKIGISSIAVTNGDKVTNIVSPSSGYIIFDVTAPGNSIVSANGVDQTIVVLEPLDPVLDGFIIGGVKLNTTLLARPFTGQIHALVYYNKNLSADEKAAVVAGYG